MVDNNIHETEMISLELSKLKEKYKELEAKIGRLNRLFDHQISEYQERTFSQKKLNELEAKVNRLSYLIDNQHNKNQNEQGKVSNTFLSLLRNNKTVNQEDDEDKLFKLKKVSKKFLASNSIYGLARAYNTKKPISKIIWYTLTLISTIYGLWICGNNIDEYYQYDIITKVETMPRKTAIFPTIVICPTYYSNNTLSVTSAFQEIGGTSFPLTTWEYSAESGDCIRFNGYKGNTSALSTVSGIEFANSFNFKIKLSESFIINIVDNYIQSYYTSETYNLDSDKYYQLKITEWSESKLEFPYNPCKTVADKTYRQINCQQTCIYEQYAVKYNCSYIAYHSFLSNNFSPNKCLDVETADRLKFKRDLWKVYKSGLEEFGAKCLAKCPDECTKVHFSVDLITRDNSSSSPIGINETFLSFYFNQLGYQNISQIPKVTVFSLIANIGGALGAFIGINFLSTFELVEYLVEVLYIVCYKYLKIYVFDRFNVSVSP